MVITQRNFNRNNCILFINSVVIGEYLYVKLHDALPDDIGVDFKCWVVEEQKSFSKAVSAKEYFNPVSKEQSGHHNYTAWVLGESFDINQLLEAHLVSLLLMDNSSSPLYGALETNEILCTALDTTDPEPLNQDSKLWTLSNCYITPHDSAWGPRAPQRAVDLFLDNFKKFCIPIALITSLILFFSRKNCNYPSRS